MCPGLRYRGRPAFLVIEIEVGLAGVLGLAGAAEVFFGAEGGGGGGVVVAEEGGATCRGVGLCQAPRKMTPARH